MRLSLTRDERTEAVVRIVRRRQRASMRVREEEEAYSSRSCSGAMSEPFATEPSEDR